MSMKEATIQINDLSIGYHSKNDTKLVASHITTTIYSGELTCLLGANGVGKSTLLRTLSAFQPRLSGEIALLSRDIQDYSDKELSTIVGVVLTDKCEIRNMTVRELIGMGRSPYTGFWGRLGKEDKQIVEESISLVRIENLASRMVHTLSDGERQKVMIAKALAQETPVIFLDEPTAGMDTSTRQRFWEIVNDLKKSGVTILYSSHYIEEVEHTADRILVLHQGKLIRDTTPYAMRHEEKEKQVTLPSSFVNIVHGLPDIYEITEKRDVISFMTKDIEKVWQKLEEAGCGISDIEIQNKTLLDSLFDSTREDKA